MQLNAVLKNLTLTNLKKRNNIGIKGNYKKLAEGTKNSPKININKNNVLLIWDTIARLRKERNQLKLLKEDLKNFKLWLKGSKNFVIAVNQVPEIALEWFLTPIHEADDEELFDFIEF